MFALFRKKYPIYTIRMIAPAGEPITTADAKTLFKQHMLEIGYLDKDQLSEHVGYLTAELKRQECCLKDEINNTKEEIQEAKGELADLQNKLVSCSTDEKEEIVGGIELLAGELAIATEELEQYASRLAEFNKDKRAFLVDYMNTLLHGDDGMSISRLPHMKTLSPGQFFLGR